MYLFDETLNIIINIIVEKYKWNQIIIFIQILKSLLKFNIFNRNNTEGIIGCILADHAGLCLGGIFS